MAKNIKITKHDLKKNEMLDLYGKAKNYLILHNNKIKPFLIGFLVAVIAAIFIFISIRNKMKEANELYTEALYKYTNQIFSGSAGYEHIIGELQKAYNTFSKSNLSKIMILNIADAYYRNKDYKNALDNYDKFLKLNSDPIFASLASYGKALVYMQQKNYGEASNLFNNLVQSKTAEFIKPDILVQLAITYSRMNEEIKAVESLTQIIEDSEYKDSPWSVYSNYLLTLLKQKRNLPEINYSNTTETDTSIFSNISEEHITDIFNQFENKDTAN